MYKCAIFDLDGTLLNTLDTLAYYCNETLKKYSLEPIETEKYRYFVGNGTWDLTNKIFAHRGCSDEKLIKEAFTYFSESYNADVTYKTSIYDGIPELIDYLRSKGLKIGLLTNKPHDTTMLLCNKIFGENYLDIYFGARDGVPRKPDTTAAKLLLKEFGAKPEEALYFGDTSTDMITGKNTGMFTIGVLWGFRTREELEENNADLIISYPSEIKKLFD